jgi:predicted TIM-barrel enzyme
MLTVGERENVRSLGKRAGDAMSRFVEIIAQAGGITKPEARKVFHHYDKLKVLDWKDAHLVGQLRVKHGAFLERETILRALDDIKAEG